MLTRILLLLATSLSLLTTAAAQYGQERPRRVTPPVENTAPPRGAAAGSTQYLVYAEAGDTPRKIAAREGASLDELERVNDVGADEELEEGREVRFYSHSAGAGRQVSQPTARPQRDSRLRNPRGARTRGRSSKSASTPDAGDVAAEEQDFPPPARCHRFRDAPDLPRCRDQPAGGSVAKISDHPIS